MTLRKRRLVSAQTKIALLLALGAGFGAVQIQPHEAPLRQNVPNVGPIPCGAYWIIAPIDSPRTGKFVLPLVAVTGTITFGRGFFEIHGENPAHPGESSHGCIVATLPEREAIAAAKGLLLVLPPLESEPSA